MGAGDSSPVLSISNLTKSYGRQLLFEDASLHMSQGERLGLMGRNGHGKTTLFRMILGVEEPDGGSIEMPRGYRMGHLEQHLRWESPTVLAVACEGLGADAENERYRAEEILFGLGFCREDLGRSPQELSGGFGVRLNLARTLVSRPDLLLLDEPTNYLDIVSVRWITRFLNAWRGELVVISHDREFMDAVTTHTAMIHRRAIRKMAGPTEKICAQIASEEEVYEKTRINEERRRAELLGFIERFKAKNTKASAARSKMKMLEKMPLRAKLEQIADLDFRFRYSHFPAKVVMEAEGISFSYDGCEPLIENLSLRIKADDRIALVGKNGKGKSTLLKLLAGEIEPISGRRRAHPSAAVGYFGQTNIERLDPKATVEDEIGSANPSLGKGAVLGLCGLMMFPGDDAAKRVSVLSGGEKSRVLLGRILAAPANLLLLDEPTNHLDMQSVEALSDSIDEFPGAVVIATHDEMILRSMATKLVLFQGGKVELFEGGYDDFLERVGWEEEGEPEKTDAPEDGASKSRKEMRRLRSKVISERSAAARPLKERIDAAETAICGLEASVREVEEKLVAASTGGEANLCGALSKKLKEDKERIEDLFAELEEATLEFERLSREFEEKLAAIGDQ